MEFSLDHLRTLVAVIDGGSFEAAAARLHVTPSAVSQRIKALETHVGRVLVLRSGRARLTDSGRIVVRLARQFELLEGDTLAALDPEAAVQTSVPLVVNADSLATWFLPAVAKLDGILLDIVREDQAHSAELLREGAVMAAITSVADAVQGCHVTALGSMTYRPLATPAYLERWMPRGLDSAALAAAPLVVFDRKDALQDDYLRSLGIDPETPPRHYVPGSSDFLEAVSLGLGWGMLPDLQSESRVRSGDLVTLDPDATAPVALYWQQWALESPALGRLAAAVIAAARSSLH